MWYHRCRVDSDACVCLIAHHRRCTWLPRPLYLAAPPLYLAARPLYLAARPLYLAAPPLYLAALPL